MGLLQAGVQSPKCDLFLSPDPVLKEQGCEFVLKINGGTRQEQQTWRWRCGWRSNSQPSHEDKARIREDQASVAEANRDETWYMEDHQGTLAFPSGFS